MSFSRIIPSKEELSKMHNPLTEGEKHLIDFLDDNLSKDKEFKENDKLENYNGWLIFAQPYLNGTRPDIIIFHPKVGIQIFEVKDWNLNNYSFQKHKNGKSHLCVSDNNGTYSIKTPKKQVEYYHEKITGLLIPQIGELIDKDARNFGLVRTALYFHNASTETVQDLFKSEIKDFNKLPSFGFNYLKKENLREIVPNSYLKESHFWKKEWNKEVLFWLKPPFHSLEQTQKLSLIDEQRKFANPISGHHRVRGVAGSGKTQVLAYRAGNLASQGKEVLILTFNITLWHFIRDMIQRSPFEFEWKHITMNHFHGFCRDILNEFGKKWPDDSESEAEIFKSIVPQKVLNVIAGKEFKKYDAILIDEGQDYYSEWYQMLRNFLTDNDEVVVVCDKKQNIYGTNTEWLDKRRKDMEKFGDWNELKKIIRLPEKIAIAAKDFAENFGLNQDVKIDKLERSDLFNQNKDHFIWLNIDKNNWLDKIDMAFEIIRKNGTYTHPSDLVILLPDKYWGNKCVKFFEKQKIIEVNHVFETDGDDKGKRKKMTFWMGDSRLKISTIHSFKGWEAPNVILFIPDKITGDVKIFDMLFYVALTRTKQNLIILNSNDRYFKFSENFSNEW